MPASGPIPPSTPGMPWQPPLPEALQEYFPQYEIVSLLGRGGMGAVYKGWQRSLDRFVAIKILPPGADDAEANYAERFKLEARSMARLMHPGIVTVFDAGQTSAGLLYFVMEFVEGTDVAHMVQAQKKLPPAHALAITAHVCDALGYAHRHGIVHRDIKPANIMVNMEGAVKVADFGLAKHSGPGAVGLTRSDMAMGTPDYVAPEALIAGVEVDARADLYAVGVMLYQMLTGEIPRGMFLMPSLRNKGETDPRFDAIIAKAMQTEREQRYQSAAELRRDLDVILTTPVVKAGDPQGSAAIPKQALPPKPVARQPQKQPAGHAAQRPASGGSQSRLPKDQPQAAQPEFKSASIAGPLLGIAATLVVVAGLVVFLGGRKPADGHHEHIANTADTSAGQNAKAAPPTKAPTSAKPKPKATPPPSAQAKSLGSTPAKTPKPDKSPAPSPSPPPPAAPDTVDTAPWANAIVLLPLVDVEKDIVKAGWRRDGNDLVSGNGHQPALLELPVIPPEEYDLRVRFTRKSGNDDITMVLSRGQRSFVWIAGARTNTVIGFGTYMGDTTLTRSFETLKTVSAVLDTGRTYTVQIVVRKNGVTAYLDGELVSKLPADLAEMHNSDLYKLRTAGALGLGTFKTSYVVHAADLREVTGKAKLLREPSAADLVGQRLAQLEQQFLAAYREQVGIAHDRAVSDLNEKFTAALNRAITTASQAGKLDEALLLRDEKTRTLDGGAVPDEDAAGAPEALLALRKTYREQLAALITARDKNAAPLHAAYDRALAAFQDELTKAQNLDQAARVKAVREHLTTHREASAPMPAPKVPEGSAAIGKAGPASVPIAPVAPPLSADKILPPLPKATPEEVRALCEWVLGKGGGVEVLEGGERRRIEDLAKLPKGRLTLLHFSIYELPMNDEGKKWLAVLGRVPELESVFFHKNPGTMPMEVFRGATKLKSLSVKPTAVDDAAFAHLAGLKSLEKLAISYMCKQFTGTGLGYINENLLEFETDSKTISAEGLAYLPRFKKLRRLDLTDSAVTDAMLPGLAALPDLESLEVTNTKLDGSFLAHLPANSKLKWLNLGRMKGFKPDNFAHLARLKNLEGILLPNANPTAAEMAFLADLGKLRTISFEDNEVFTGEGFQGLKGFSSLTALDFDICPLTDAGLEAIASAMPGLKSLIISREKNGKATFTPEGISTHLGRLRNLTHFKAGHSGFTDEWMPHIAQLKNVTDLSLIGAGITDAGLVHLKNLPLTELRLDQTGVTDAAVPILKTFPKLTNVNLGSANKLTDAGKAELQRFLDGNKGK